VTNNTTILVVNDTFTTLVTTLDDRDVRLLATPAGLVADASVDDTFELFIVPS